MPVTAVGPGETEEARRKPGRYGARGRGGGNKTSKQRNQKVLECMTAQKRKRVPRWRHGGGAGGGAGSCR